ncbi:EF-hand domain pair [Phytophthora cactorum]|nr:EF-hand domain pair [Phytophthora cactorum]
MTSHSSDSIQQVAFSPYNLHSLTKSAMGVISVGASLGVREAPAPPAPASASNSSTRRSSSSTGASSATSNGRKKSSRKRVAVASVTPSVSMVINTKKPVGRMVHVKTTMDPLRLAPHVIGVNGGKLNDIMSRARCSISYRKTQSLEPKENEAFSMAFMISANTAKRVEDGVLLLQAVVESTEQQLRKYEGDMEQIQQVEGDDEVEEVAVRMETGSEHEERKQPAADHQRIRQQTEAHDAAMQQVREDTTANRCRSRSRSRSSPREEIAQRHPKRKLLRLSSSYTCVYSNLLFVLTGRREGGTATSSASKRERSENLRTDSENHAQRSSQHNTRTQDEEYKDDRDAVGNDAVARAEEERHLRDEREAYRIRLARTVMIQRHFEAEAKRAHAQELLERDKYLHLRRKYEEMEHRKKVAELVVKKQCSAMIASLSTSSPSKKKQCLREIDQLSIAHDACSPASNRVLAPNLRVRALKAKRPDVSKLRLAECQFIASDFAEGDDLMRLVKKVKAFGKMITSGSMAPQPVEDSSVKSNANDDEDRTDTFDFPCEDADISLDASNNHEAVVDASVEIHADNNEEKSSPRRDSFRSTWDLPGLTRDLNLIQDYTSETDCKLLRFLAGERQYFYLEPLSDLFTYILRPIRSSAIESSLFDSLPISLVRETIEQCPEVVNHVLQWKGKDDVPEYLREVDSCESEAGDLRSTSGQRVHPSSTYFLRNLLVRFTTHMRDLAVLMKELVATLKEKRPELHVDNANHVILRRQRIIGQVNRLKTVTTHVIVENTKLQLHKWWLLFAENSCAWFDPDDIDELDDRSYDKFTCLQDALYIWHNEALLYTTKDDFVNPERLETEEESPFYHTEEDSIEGGYNTRAGGSGSSSFGDVPRDANRTPMPREEEVAALLRLTPASMRDGVQNRPFTRDEAKKCILTPLDVEKARTQLEESLAVTRDLMNELGHAGPWRTHVNHSNTLKHELSKQVTIQKKLVKHQWARYYTKYQEFAPLQVQAEEDTSDPECEDKAPCEGIETQPEGEPTSESGGDATSMAIDWAGVFDPAKDPPDVIEMKKLRHEITLAKDQLLRDISGGGGHASDAPLNTGQKALFEECEGLASSCMQALGKFLGMEETDKTPAIPVQKSAPMHLRPATKPARAEKRAVSASKRDKASRTASSSGRRHSHGSKKASSYSKSSPGTRSRRIESIRVAKALAASSAGLLIPTTRSKTSSSRAMSVRNSSSGFIASLNATLRGTAAAPSSRRERRFKINPVAAQRRGSNLPTNEGEEASPASAHGRNNGEPPPAFTRSRGPLPTFDYGIEGAFGLGPMDQRGQCRTWRPAPSDKNEQEDLFRAARVRMKLVRSTFAKSMGSSSGSGCLDGEQLWQPERIRMMWERRDFHGVLGLPRDATTQQIKRQYRKLALKLHPDKASDASASLESTVAEAGKDVGAGNSGKRVDAFVAATHSYKILLGDVDAMRGLGDSNSMDVNRIFSAEQIAVPPDLPHMLKDWTKAVIRENPTDLLAFSQQWFQDKATQVSQRKAVENQIRRMRQLFESYDVDGQGRMEAKDLGKFLGEDLGMDGYEDGSPAELLEDLVMELDPENTGFVELHDIIQWYQQR